MIWHSNDTASVLEELRVDPSVGLSKQEAANRLKEYGKNCLSDQKSLSFRQTFAKQLRAPLHILLFIVSGLTLVLNLYKQLLKDIPTNWQLSVAVAVGAIVVTLLNAIQQYRASSAVSHFRALSAPETRVRRDGSEQVCSTHALVPGDIVLLTVGDIVPADCRLIEADRLRCDECDLIGATMPTEKYAETVFDDITPLAQRTNMLYAGTAITDGTATAVVVATGVRSEMGHSHGRQQQAHKDLPMQKKANRLNMRWGIAVAVLSIVALIIGLVRYSDRLAVLLTATTLAAAAVPGGIAALNTCLTADSMQRLLRHRVRIHHPEAADTLGQVTVLCIDQEMLHQEDGVELCRAFVGHRTVDLTATTPQAPGLGQLMRLAALNTVDTDPTDAAILSLLPKMGIDKNELLLDMPRIGELSPTYERKTAVHLAGEQTLILVSGEWRSLLPLCTKGNTDELTAAATTMERDGLQVTAVTYRLTDTAPAVYTAEELEQDLTCVGLLGLRIPLRSDTPSTNTGVRTLLFSDESAAIAAATAQSAGLTDAPHVAIAEAIDALTDQELATAVQHYNVYCGLSTPQKQRILTALQQQGEVVAVTACHSEEADLLTAADVGCARGTYATDVAKEAADLILTEDSHAALHAAISEGRRLRWEKVGMLAYLLLCTCVLLFIGFGSLFGLLPISYCAALLMGLHLLLLALPTPLWITKGVSEMLHKLRKKN